MIADVKQALAQGLLTMADVERGRPPRAEHPLPARRVRPGGGPYGAIGADAVNTPGAPAAGPRRPPAEATVLLKNDGGALPLDAARRKRRRGRPARRHDLHGLVRRHAALHGDPGRRASERVGAGASSRQRGRRPDRAQGRRRAAGTSRRHRRRRSPPRRTRPPTRPPSSTSFDWGQGIVTLRNVANGHVSATTGGGFVTRDDAAQRLVRASSSSSSRRSPTAATCSATPATTSAESWFGARTST